MCRRVDKHLDIRHKSVLCRVELHQKPRIFKLQMPAPAPMLKIRFIIRARSHLRYLKISVKHFVNTHFKLIQFIIKVLLKSEMIEVNAIIKCMYFFHSSSVPIFWILPDEAKFLRIQTVGFIEV